MNINTYRDLLNGPTRNAVAGLRTVELEATFLEKLLARGDELLPQGREKDLEKVWRIADPAGQSPKAFQVNFEDLTPALQEELRKLQKADGSSKRFYGYFDETSEAFGYCKPNANWKRLDP